MFTSGSGRFIQNITPIQNIQTSVTGNSLTNQVTALQSTVTSLLIDIATLKSQISTLNG